VCGEKVKPEDVTRHLMRDHFIGTLGWTTEVVKRGEK
jgi:hypothetical protein